MTMHRWLLACTLALAAAAPATAKQPVARPLPQDSVYQLDARLVDQSGKSLALRDLRGRPRVVAMFYTSCRYICPLIIDSAIGVEKRLTPAEKAALGVTLVSMDPRRDTPAALMSVANRRRMDLARWSLLRPDPGDVRAIAGLLGVRYRELADGEFNHTSALVLLDADGRIVARTEKIGSVADPAFVAAVRTALAPRK